jgi:hypothetical protein
VSSDGESISAAEEWLSWFETAIRESAIVMILCSPSSIRRPWINFEAGAAWMLGIPVIPSCHAGLAKRDLPMPLSTRQGVSLAEPRDLATLYSRNRWYTQVCYSKAFSRRIGPCSGVEFRAA